MKKNIIRLAVVTFSILIGYLIYLKLNGAVVLGHDIYSEGVGMILPRYSKFEAIGISGLISSLIPLYAYARGIF